MTNEEKQVADWIELPLENIRKKTKISRCSLPAVMRVSSRWWASPLGYIYATIRRNGKKTTYSLHRVVTNCPPGLVVHHKDENPMNNTLENLQPMDNAENVRWQTKKRGASKYKGVYWKNDRDKWQVNIVRKHYGHFDNEDDAGAVAKRVYERIGGIYK